MKRILHISKYYYPFRGGIEQVARECVNALRDNYEQEVVCFSEGKDDSEDIVDGVRIVRIGCFIKISSQSISISYGRILKKEIDDFKPDIIIFHYPNPFVASLLLKRISDKSRLVLYWHLDIVKQKLLKLFFIRQNQQLIRRADQIIATSVPYIEGSRYLSSVCNKCIVIPNCINEKRLEINNEIRKRATEIRERNNGKIICVALGRHTKYKGFDYLVKASHLLDDSFVFFLIGKGEETKRLRKMARDDKKIEFLGRLEECDLKAYMLAMDIFCFPSVTKNEAFGISLAEAMYFGKPSVTFTIKGSGVNYVCIKDENGIEVPNKNVLLYSEAIRKLASNKVVREEMGKAAKNRVMELFTSDHYIHSIKKAMEQL